MSKILDGLPEEGEMNPTQEAAIANSIQQTQDEALKNNLVLHNMREAVRYGMGVSKGRLPEGEIMSVCYTALLKAAKNFRPGDIRFFAYAKVYVRGEICNLWRQKDVVKNASQHESEENLSDISLFERDSTEQELAETCLPDYESFTRPEEVAEPDFKGIDLREKWNIIKPLIEKCLNEREQMVIKLVYISGMTFDAISHALVPTISRAAVQHTHARALRKLRSALNRNGALLIA